jgi:Fe-Mn family superoxide dismutase
MSAPFELPKLPYSGDALAPTISAQTISIHYGKHHQAYITNLNKLVVGTPYAEMTLEQIVTESRKDQSQKGIFNNSAQVWNHTFYWNSLSPKPTQPSAKLLGMIEKTWGSFDEFKTKFAAAAVGQFGSGWAWLSLKNGALEITTTGNAETPLGTGATPLLTVDVWEHAYYLDFQNRRPDYAKDAIDKLLNWEFAEKNLG